METREISEKLVAQRALYERSVREADEAAEKIKEILNSFSDDTIAKLKLANFDLNVIKNIDVDRMRSDSRYLMESKRTLSEFITQLHRYLETKLNV